MALHAPGPERPAREGFWLALALWALVFPLFLGPSLAAEHSNKAVLPLMLGLDVVVGFCLTAPLYLAIRRTGALRPAVRVVAVAATVLVISYLTSLVDAENHGWLYRGAPGDFSAKFWNLAGLNLIIYLPIYGLYAAALALISSNRAIRLRERQLVEAQAAAHQAQLAALRYQLNPHFLFNTLNAISTLIVTRRNDEAEAMMDKLADFLRASLSADPESFIPLEDELATVQAYLDIEAVRFGERLAVGIDCPPQLSEALVPSLLLQPLVENAIKYAVAPSLRTVTIAIEAAADGDDLVLTVDDDGDPAERGATRKGTGVGLRNVRERLAVLYGARGQLEAAPRQRGFLAVVRMPLQRGRAAGGEPAPLADGRAGAPLEPQAA